MNTIEKISTAIVESLEKNDLGAYKRGRNELLIKVADQDHFDLEDIGDYFIVGKALAIILDDMNETPPMLHKRVVLCAVYCLLKTITSDKNGEKDSIVQASALLYILFSENKDFIGGEYIMSKLRNNTQQAVFQFIGMQSVFYWKYKLSNLNTQFLPRIEQRLDSAVSPSTSKIPDESTRQKIIDFEYGNFSSLLECIPIDIRMRYPGVFIDPFDSEILELLTSVFKSNTSNFIKKEVQANTAEPSTITSKKSNKSGCMPLTLICITAIFIAMIFLT